MIEPSDENGAIKSMKKENKGIGIRFQRNNIAEPPCAGAVATSSLPV